MAHPPRSFLLPEFSRRNSASRAVTERQRAVRRERRPPVKITDIEIIPIYPRIAARNAEYKARFIDINQRTVFRVRTDNGLVGYGDYRCGAPSRASVEKLIGRSPF